jgi:hypothetical protein
MTPQSEPKPEAGDDRSEYERTGQHGPEMDDTQVAATEGLRDEWPPVTDEPSADEPSGDGAG